ncbi:MAG: protein translocase subunit SecF [Alphaproteobacteria bacterium]|nr:protein translocase subunit SecF [Alphaproteobacteria bacterium]
MAIFPLRLVPPNTKIDFIGKRKIAFVLSALLIIASMGFFAIKGLNYGIDFKGGILMEVRTPGPADIDGLRSKLSGLGLGEVAIQEFGQPTDVLIRVERQPGGEKAQQVAVDTVKTALGTAVASYRRTEFVGPKVGGELIQAGVLAVVLSLFAIMVYVWFRFEWQFSVGAVVALIHDVIVTIGIFSVLGLEFNLATVAAILTIAGYSINDTVVVFDRIRENLRKFKTMGIEDLLNQSLNQTLSRTLLTSVTTLLALFAIFFFGGAVIRDFAFALIWGVFVGTYSSVYVASPVVMMLNIRGNISSGSVGGAEKEQELLSD